jgi:hypothetical protein
VKVEGGRWKVEEGEGEGGRWKVEGGRAPTSHGTASALEHTRQHSPPPNACMRAHTVLSGAVEAEDPQLARWQPGEHGGGPGCHCCYSPSDCAKICSQAPYIRLDCGDFSACSVGTERHCASTRALSHCSQRIISFSSCHHTTLSSRARWKVISVARKRCQTPSCRSVVRVMWFCGVAAQPQHTFELAKSP